MLAHVNPCKKKTLEIHFIYLNKEIYCIFKICCIISALFSTKFHLLNNFIFFVQIILAFFIKYALKFKYHLVGERLTNCEWYRYMCLLTIDPSDNNYFNQAYQYN